MPDTAKPNDVKLDVFKTYEDGKHRRYNLLFSVNGGAFAIARILAAKPQEQLLTGNLHQWHLSVGMAAFSVLMVSDIYEFANKMSRLEKETGGRVEIFGRKGKQVLISIGILLCLAWLLAAGFVGRI